MDSRNPFTIRSVSHHTVLSDGHTWVKIARDQTPAACTELDREHRVLEVLNVPHGFTSGPPAILTTPHLGTPANLTDYLTGSFLPALRTYQQVTVPGMPAGHARTGLVREKTLHRVKDPAVSDWCLTVLDRVGNPDLSGTTLCHTDPHPKNWLRDPSGAWILIDWESAVTAAPEVDLAAVAHSFYLNNALTQAQSAGLFDQVNDDKFQASLAIKMVSGVSWVAAAHGTSAAHDRIRFLLDGPAWFIPDLIRATPMAPPTGRVSRPTPG